MRLICPNCDAEYEVDEAAIPEEGRDVLCSACGHSWFQEPPGKLAEKEEEAALFDAPSFDQSLVAPVDKKDEAEAGEEGEAGEPGGAPPAGGPAVPPMGGRSIDESLMAVLREEAARETAARREESAGLETQTEMPLAGSSSAASVLRSDELAVPETEEQAVAGRAGETVAGSAAGASAEISAESAPEIVAGAQEESAGKAGGQGANPAGGDAEGAPVEAAMDAGVGARAGEDLSAEADAEPAPGPATAAMRKIAKLRGKAEPPADAAVAAKSAAEGEDGPTGRELLPEIEEINSTLRDAGESRDVDEGAVASTIEEGARGGGFRDGFLAVMVLVILGGALYLAAPFVAARVPALQPAMMAYVHAVDGLRIGLDALVRGLSNWVSRLTGGTG